MIKLTSTETHEYFAVPAPVDAEIIEVENGYLYYETVETIIEKSIKLPNGAELLGVTGQGHEISDEAAISIMKPYQETTLIGEYYYADKKMYSNPLTALKVLLKDQGILVENPIEKPSANEAKYFNSERVDGCHLFELYNHDFDQWQSYESKLVKAVIIKVKK